MSVFAAARRDRQIVQRTAAQFAVRGFYRSRIGKGQDIHASLAKAYDDRP